MENDSDNSSEPTRYLRLCTHDPCKVDVVEALCIICFKDYEVGEQVVWSSSSTNDCRHVYHKDCILKWISTGKKKCPVCRYAFVPDSLPSRETPQARQDTEQATNDTTLPQGPNAV